MRIPSYLVRNRFGTYYFRIVFPEDVYAILQRKETRKSLRTWDKTLARSISIEFQQICQRLFNIIISENMKWIEVKRVLDKVADYLFSKYVEQVDQDGFDFDDKYSLVEIMPEAFAFVGPSENVYGHDLYRDMKSGRMVNRGEFEASYHKEPAVQGFVDEIASEYNLSLDKEGSEYKKFCFQVLQMLYRLDSQKSQYKDQALYGGGAPAASNTISSNQKNKLPHKTIREVVDLYADYKIKIDKSWNKPPTAKGYTENLNRIADMFEYISGSTKTSISEYDKEAARKIQKVLSIIPTHLNKKYPKLTLGEVIRKCEKGEIAQTEKERMKASTINTYAILINGLFN